MTESPTAAQLPAGHDDAEGLTYVPEPLRPHWPGPLDRLDEVDAEDRYGIEARRDVALRDVTRRRDYADWHARQFGRPPTVDPTPGRWRAYLGWNRELPPLTTDERHRAAHLLATERARTAWRAERTAAQHAAFGESLACPVCGDTAGLGHPCPRCRPLVEAERLRLAGAEVLPDGRRRADAVAAWVAARSVEAG
jgi:hypothetical protein